MMHGIVYGHRVRAVWGAGPAVRRRGALMGGLGTLGWRGMVPRKNFRLLI